MTLSPLSLLKNGEGKGKGGGRERERERGGEKEKKNENSKIMETILCRTRRTNKPNLISQPNLNDEQKQKF